MIERGASSTALTLRTDYPDWSLPAHRRGTLSGMDAAPEPTRTYLRRVLRWWAGKDLQQSRRSSALQLIYKAVYQLLYLRPLLGGRSGRVKSAAPRQPLELSGSGSAHCRQ
ncbi:hypothetical protein CPBF424_26680 [Xanthomonas euroxanthea]|uniref:Uncharacterized protein n=1 Tax=Xanthomonas euroxanthea TaxID=2259622 RepID=A0AA46HB52_9XANT|nr:hypothetical protein CPBF424_26680 [Xanthomonas euroxanthea]